MQNVSTEIYLPQAPESVISHRFASSENIPWLSALEEPVDRHPDETRSCRMSPWCASIWKRAFDLACVIPTLIIISPLLGLIAIAVRLTSPGPVIFRQQRAGQHRKLFTIYKVRTMVENSEAIGPGHTAKGDPRITLIGNLLRRFKLDELPQLYNVLRGDMSLVGPRPKLPQHDHTPMACRPGVTGAATLAFRDEQHILCIVPADQLEIFYQEHVVPLKIQIDADYMSRATIVADINVLVATVFRIGKYLTHRDFFLSSSRSVEHKTSQAPIALQNN
jgi:lipopolysaccharide/colanic/teichoic acid biosynthesis glycosyltransferase